MFDEAVAEYRDTKARELYTHLINEHTGIPADFAEQCFRDGIEFGYNKMKEEADKMKSRFLELCKLKDMRIKELEKANEWHYPSKGEYPKEEDEYLVIFESDGTKYKGLESYYPDTKEWSTICKIIAWEEIVLPELPKESE